MIKKYRKKPVEIEAIKWTGRNQTEIYNFINNNNIVSRKEVPGLGCVILIETLEGTHAANIGDYIIKGVKGEFYPCKPDIFEMTYGEVEIEEKNEIK